MSKFRILALAGASCLVALSSIQCGRPGTEKGGGTAPAAAVKPGDDFKATMDAYNKTNDAGTKIRLWRDFLSRNPNNSYTLGTIDYVVSSYYLKEKNDPEGAVKFALENMAKIMDEKLKRRADSGLLRLYGKVGRKEQLRELAAHIQTTRELSLTERLEVADAAAEAKDWDLARNQCDALLTENTPEKIRADAGAEKRTDEQVKNSLERYRGQALTLLGRASLELKDTKAALAHFAEAGKLAKYDYAGLPVWPFEDLNLHWAKALLESGDARGAMAQVSRDAIIQEKKDAIDLLGEAHRGAGIKETLQRYIERRRPAITKPMPQFAAYDYDKKKVRYDQMKGTVTLLAFWSPT